MLREVKGLNGSTIHAPEWNVGQPITRTFEDQLYSYYARQRGIDSNNESLSRSEVQAR